MPDNRDALVERQKPFEQIRQRTDIDVAVCRSPQFRREIFRCFSHSVIVNGYGEIVIRRFKF
jgi:hypothetical protein